MDTYGIDYNDLKPGIYLQAGVNMKMLDVNRGQDNDILAAFGLTRRVAANELANKEAWTFTALSRRGSGCSPFRTIGRRANSS